MGKTRMTVGQAIVKFLNQQYVVFDGEEHRFVDGIFTIFGHGIVAGLGQALEEDPGDLRVYHGRNEQGMAHVAISYAKQNNRRRIIACTSSIGPGAANMVTAAGTATVNNVPLLLFPADTFATRQPDPVLQQIEQSNSLATTTNDAFKPVCNYWDRVSRPEQLMTALINAMRVLTNPATAGAVCVAIPQDVQGESFDFPDYFFEKRVHRIMRTPADSAQIEDAVEMIMNAKKPFFVGGGGARYSEAGATLQKLCEDLTIPYGETQGGKSATPSSSPMNMGGVGVTGTLSANTIAEQADLVVGVGTRFNDFVTGSKEIFRNKNVKFLTINVSDYHAEKMDATKVVGDAKVNLEAIGEQLRAKNYKTDFTKEYLKEVKDEFAKELENIKNLTYTGKDFVPLVASWTPEIMNDYLEQIGGQITETNGLSIVRDVIADDAIVVSASGSLPADMERMWTTDEKDSYNMEYGYSCMGYEVQGALGAKLARPDKEVYAIVGDGAFLMLNSELTTAIQEKKKINVVLFDNAAFGCINNLQMGNGIGSLCTEFRYRNEETGKTDGDYIHVDFAKVGEGYGLKTYTAKTPEELRAALEDSKKQEVSTLIDAKVLPKTMAEGYKSWWHVGVASTSKSVKTQEACKNKEEKLNDARMY
ncbi:3D-(3,5/4)-trihydroxycyclohexane-1,2-dione acylhydrolase (decyclizing) [Aequitasia blattaphilus]|uniref:3D-(3,5/4)-trihydroxycyclohexane-1,2-dione acylhydrolase (Decyclizing) n=1 Tax=Aequitasia blattaphilus TaxID=2949332 RepID=A0ABT1ECW1_9FIRM|nr:3D-(3,5/4)-trihydroxycyclohexane-1,2-dione acylhydrolase (decyclizing) [Aequitasia blattaphilus]MCP1103684.1 3D-(3,5/4)-trihydroxycyclohexane-1,2-dione acylhydrolase (decyclizing) [Aequitasia blattaphilus]MCR8616324.1 3D-(3,5/4)-trihydroxycyclohexane-1,2-dione acylhydrolase (decyclizing) [Aequitasia blattaphilus]